jgi:hypothetical protein
VELAGRDPLGTVIPEVFRLIFEIEKRGGEVVVVGCRL